MFQKVQSKKLEAWIQILKWCDWFPKRMHCSWHPEVRPNVCFEIYSWLRSVQCQNPQCTHSCLVSGLSDTCFHNQLPLKRAQLHSGSQGIRPRCLFLLCAPKRKILVLLDWQTVSFFCLTDRKWISSCSWSFRDTLDIIFPMRLWALDAVKKKQKPQQRFVNVALVACTGYGDEPVWLLGFFELSEPVEGHRDEWPNLKWSAGVSCVWHEACLTISRVVMKMKHTIVIHVLSVSWRICKNNVSCTHLWCLGDAVAQCHYATL